MHWNFFQLNINFLLNVSRKINNENLNSIHFKFTSLSLQHVCMMLLLLLFIQCSFHTIPLPGVIVYPFRILVWLSFVVHRPNVVHRQRTPSFVAHDADAASAVANSFHFSLHPY